MPNPQAFIKQIEQSIAVEEASLVKELDPTTGTGKNLADAKRALSEVTDWIAQLSPAELAAPSCYAEKGTTLRARFTTVAAAGCRPLVRPNYGYFNAALPRSAPQVVIITGIKRCFDTADKYNLDANSPSPSAGAAPIARWSRRWTRTRSAPGCAERPAVRSPDTHERRNRIS